MALSLTKTNDAGVITTYHRIGNVSLRDNSLSCVLESYASREYRNLQRSADSTFFRFEITTEEEESMGIRALCYTKIKTLPEWAEAEDC